MNETNPYATPHARVDEVVSSRGAINEFERFTTWGVFGLTMVTLSCYVPYWLYTRTQVLDRVLPANPVPRALVYASIGSFFLNILLFVVGAVLGSAVLAAAASVLNNISIILLLVWVYMFRSRLNTVLGAEPGDPLRLGAIMPFFFHVLYLQYKINQAIDSQPALALRPA